MYWARACPAVVHRRRCVSRACAIVPNPLAEILSRQRPGTALSCLSGIRVREELDVGAAGLVPTAGAQRLLTFTGDGE